MATTACCLSLKSLRSVGDSFPDPMCCQRWERRTPHWKQHEWTTHHPNTCITNPASDFKLLKLSLIYIYCICIYINCKNLNKTSWPVGKFHCKELEKFKLVYCMLPLLQMMSMNKKCLEMCFSNLLITWYSVLKDSTHGMRCLKNSKIWHNQLSKYITRARPLWTHR